MLAVLPLGLCDLLKPMVRAMSLADRDAVWSLWQALINGLQLRLLEFWSKALPSSVNG